MATDQGWSGALEQTFARAAGDAARATADAATPAPPQPSVESQPREDSGSHLPAAELNWPQRVAQWVETLPLPAQRIGIGPLICVRTHLREARHVWLREALSELHCYLFGAWSLALELDAPVAATLDSARRELFALLQEGQAWLNAQERAAIRDGGPLEHLRDTREEADR
jgi:hypothetical protein